MGKCRFLGPGVGQSFLTIPFSDKSRFPRLGWDKEGLGESEVLSGSLYYFSNFSLVSELSRSLEFQRQPLAAFRVRSQ